jgi:hypothetical protein
MIDIVLPTKINGLMPCTRYSKGKTHIQRQVLQVEGFLNLTYSCLYLPKSIILLLLFRPNK